MCGVIALRHDIVFPVGIIDIAVFVEGALCIYTRRFERCASAVAEFRRGKFPVCSEHGRSIIARETHEQSEMPVTRLPERIRAEIEREKLTVHLGRENYDITFPY